MSPALHFTAHKDINGHRPTTFDSLEQTDETQNKTKDMLLFDTGKHDGLETQTIGHVGSKIPHQ